jgi:uncharacterized protein
MEQFVLAFITGLTTGGLSCLAVQGGLLASSLANQIERDIQLSSTLSANQKLKQSRHLKLRIALPILLFLAAKLAAYTALGALLGMLGSLVSLDPNVQAVMLILIGVFVIGNGLRMLNAHPIFRYFMIEPPKFITRFIRRKARDDADLTTPLALGGLTVFIPCGITQTMMAAALAIGNPVMGAALMFSFVLGTSPVFFLVAYFATQLGSRWEGAFTKLIAVVLLGLGILTINSGLNAIGSPLALSNLSRITLPANGVSADVLSPALRDRVAISSEGTQLTLAVVDSGYYPQVLHARANNPVHLVLVSENTQSCARSFVIPSLSLRALLPATGEVSLDLPPQSAGSVLRFSCSMGMYTGQIVFDL